jgi:6-phospho-3-hexuloisomerase
MKTPATFHDRAATVTAEIQAVLQNVNEADVVQVVQAIVNARHIVVHGAGRVGLACKGFAMRLGHLGFHAFAVSDACIPAVGEGDLVLVASSSGETQTVYDVAMLAKSHRARVAAISAIANSRIANAADLLVRLTTPTKFGPTPDASSVQPMATLFEQCLQILFDCLVLQLMQETQQSSADLWARHTNLD